MRKITYISSLVLIFLIPWEDSVSTISMGSLARLAGFVVAGFWLGTIVLEGKFRKPHLFHALVLVFFLWNFVSVFWSSDAENTIQRIKTYSQIFLLMLIYWEVFQKPEDLMAGLQAYVFGAYVLVAGTIYNYLAGNIAVKYEGRYSATGVNAVDLALLLTLGLPIALQLYFVASREKKGFLLQLVNLLYLPLSVFSIVLTGSRTSLLAIIPFVAFMIGTQQIKVERKILIFITVLVTLLILFPFIPQSLIYRLGSIGSSIGEGDLGGRINLWWESIVVLAKHPIFGIGSGAVASNIGSAVHNTFISVITETGFIGFVLFLSVLGIVIYEAVNLPKGISGLWLAILATWAIGVLSLSWEFRKITWIILSFVVVESSFSEQLRAQNVKILLSGGMRQSSDLSESAAKSNLI